MSLRVLHINTNSQGGAAQSAIRIHRAHISSGMESHILFLKGPLPGGVPNAHLLENHMSKGKVFLLDKINRLLNYRHQWGKPPCFFNDPRTLFRLENMDFVQSFDVLHLHWVVKFLHIPGFFNTIRQPVVWTMHDMNPFSGGLHYRIDYPSEAYDGLEQSFKAIKKNAYRQCSSLGIIGPSQWLLEEAKRSGTFPEWTTYQSIKYPIDFSVFHPQEWVKRGEIQQDLHTTANKRKTTVLFVAEKTGDIRKGFHQMMEAIKELPDSDFHFKVLGNLHHQWSEKVEQAGFINDPNRMAEEYRNADMFVIPSLEDNLPNTVIESLSCGTPVVGFATGGIVDMVTHEYNGYIATHGDVQDLAEGMRYISRNNQDGHMRINAYRSALEQFNPEIVGQSYLNFYRQLQTTSS
jgi:glycosyltransferase involved in cell wall biosynthesis